MHHKWNLFVNYRHAWTVHCCIKRELHLPLLFVPCMGVHTCVRGLQTDTCTNVHRKVHVCWVCVRGRNTDREGDVRARSVGIRWHDERHVHYLECYCLVTVSYRLTLWWFSNLQRTYSMQRLINNDRIHWCVLHSFLLHLIWSYEIDVG